MFLVIREVIGKNKHTKIPLRLYENAKDAYNFINNYMKESSGEYWTKIWFEPSTLDNKFIQRQLWWRKLKNGDRESLNIRYMKVYN